MNRCFWLPKATTQPPPPPPAPPLPPALRLTAEEREAVERAMAGYAGWMEDNCVLDTPEVRAVLYRLRGILERLK